MIENTLLSHCLHPIKVPNRQLNCYNYVPCGKCRFCKSHPLSVLRQKLDNEIRVTNYTYVFTLTYDSNHVRSIRLLYDGSFQLHNIFRYQDQFNISKFLNSINFNLDDFHKVSNIQKNKNEVYVNLYSDYQLFIKRLRKYILKTYKTKVRFFTTLEYGCQTYRPHAHFIIFSPVPLNFTFQNLKASKSVICRELTRLWSYGFVTYDGVPLKSSSLSSYLSNYVNSDISLPSLLSYKLFRSRSVHSSFLGINPQITIQDVEQFPFEYITKQVVSTSTNKTIPFNLFTNSESSYFFPKLPFFNLHTFTSFIQLSSHFITNNQFRFKSLSDFSHYIMLNRDKSFLSSLFGFLFINTSSSCSCKLSFNLIDSLISDFPQPSRVNIFNLFTNVDVPFLCNNYCLSYSEVTQTLTSLSRLSSVYYYFRSLCNRFISDSFSIYRYAKLLFRIHSLSSSHLLNNSLYVLQNSRSDFVNLYYSLLGSSSSFSVDVLHSLEYLQNSNIDKFIKHKQQSSNL